MKLLVTDTIGLILSHLRSSGFTKAADYIKKKANYKEEEEAV